MRFSGSAFQAWLITQFLIAINHYFNKRLSLRQRRATFTHKGMDLSCLLIDMLYSFVLLCVLQAVTQPRAMGMKTLLIKPYSATFRQIMDK